jgi:two-component system, NarL family, nitrate/nitrite response regulator NarL
MATKRPAQIEVLIVDDQRTFAEALATALRLERDLSVQVAASGAEAVRMSDNGPPDVVLLDVQMPGLSGIEVIRLLRESHPRVPVIMLSGHEDDLLRARAIEAGAIGYLSKLTPLAELPEAVRRASRGERLMELEEAARLMRYLRHRRHHEATERQRANRLTPRQTEILQMLADGVPIPQIAEQLSVSRLTLRTHVQNILTRLGVHTKAEAVAVGIRHGKISARV